ncbi:MAG: dihydroorotate dehydrogenase-like protein [Sandaracinaceae bacterium]|nr:dihydroorotate dehydrogenase-like protein [Sandaracinaceae bacterium]
MADLRTTYMGLELAHPVVASASPVSRATDGVRQLEDGGAAAVVMFSLFEEQIRHEAAAVDHLMALGAESFAESLSYFPTVPHFRVGPDRYLELGRRAREAVSIPVIASLNGVTSEGWIDYAKQLEHAGASAIELNVYQIPADLETSGRAVEEGTVAVLRAVKSSVSIPVAIKLSPFFSAFGHMAKQLDEAGADALVLFNRFYQPDLDVEKREVMPSLHLSTPDEIRLPLLWLAILRGRVSASLAATTGVHGGLEATKYVLAGADVVMSTSAVLMRGPSRLRAIAEGLEQWLDAHDYASVAQARGSMSQQRVKDPSAYERANYIRVLESY